MQLEISGNIPQFSASFCLPSWGSEAVAFERKVTGELQVVQASAWQLLIFALADFPFANGSLAIETANLLSAPLCKLHLHLNCAFFQRIGLVNNGRLNLRRGNCAPCQTWDWSDIWLLLFPLFQFNNSMWHYGKRNWIYILMKGGSAQGSDTLSCWIPSRLAIKTCFPQEME